MKGQSHDELHKWLLPHIKLIKELETAESGATPPQAVIAQLRASFQSYNTYFQ